ncbi:MAG: lysine exporter LysO family protein [Tannerellaceae bacterium]|jgi:uncharacterized membrane protein YbjE (DUF340 family)|nr:lysine exporter LysO family protein [Tannerellaceae bacterium]
MKGSFLMAGFFASGCFLGWQLDQWKIGVLGDVAPYVLYILMFQVGVSIGSDKKTRAVLAGIRPKLLLVPLATIAGTLSFSALAGLVVTKWRIVDCLAIGSGFGYYSLSSILIAELREASYGTEAATELGAIALMANMMREMMALFGAPVFVKYFGRLAPVCAGGATTMDVTLGVITRYSGKDMAFVAIFHGMLVDMSVPFLASFFCSL